MLQRVEIDPKIGVARPMAAASSWTCVLVYVRVPAERRDRRYPQGPAGGSCCGGLRFAPTSLWCSLWDRAANSLHSLRSLRSNRRGESVFGRALRAPIPETALLAATEIAPRRPLRVAPAAQQRFWTPPRTQLAIHLDPARIRAQSSSATALAATHRDLPWRAAAFVRAPRPEEGCDTSPGAPGKS